IAEGSFRRREPPEIKGSGYVVKSLEAAVWAFHDAEDFRQAVLWAVNLGDYAGTTGVVCGQLAGAGWGGAGVCRGGGGGGGGGGGRAGSHRARVAGTCGLSRHAHARRVFGRLLSIWNDVGLLAES